MSRKQLVILYTLIIALKDFLYSGSAQNYAKKKKKNLHEHEMFVQICEHATQQYWLCFWKV